MSLIRFEAVSLTFGDQKILVEADLALEPGERVCLIGRNGAGKSTTLKLITGKLDPDSGEIVRSSSASSSSRCRSRTTCRCATSYARGSRPSRRC